MTAPTIRGSEFELLNEQTLFAAEQARLEEQAEIREKVGGGRERPGYDAYREHNTLWQERNVR